MAFHRLYLQLKEELASDFKGVSSNNIGFSFPTVGPGILTLEIVAKFIKIPNTLIF